MADDAKPPYPLPDLPRIPYPRTVGELFIRWYEWDDWAAAAKLTDALREEGRNDHARAVMRIMAERLSGSTGNWQRSEAFALLAWDVFDFNACSEQMGEILARYQERMRQEDDGFDDDGSTDDPVARLIGFAAARGFVPITESETPLVNDAGVPVGMQQDIGFRLTTLFEDDDGPDYLTDPHPPAGDAV